METLSHTLEGTGIHFENVFVPDKAKSISRRSDVLCFQVPFPVICVLYIYTYFTTTTITTTTTTKPLFIYVY